VTVCVFIALNQNFLFRPGSAERFNCWRQNYRWWETKKHNV